VRIFSPVTGSGGTIKLNHARYRDIQAFNLEFVFITKGIVTVKSILPGELQTDLAELGPSLPRFENFTQISLTLDPKESIQILKSRGDTLREGELIARKNLAQFFQDQIALNAGRIQSLENQRSAFLSEIDQKIAAAEHASKLDSTERSQQAELSNGGFTSGRQLEQSDLKWRKSKTALLQLNTARSVTLSRTALEIRRLTLANRQLESKATAAEKQSEVRSTVSGILIDIRQVPHNNKTQVTFIIKRTGPSF
jgi:vacuolar-type H+-ATPase subunit I/STV1